MTIQKTKKSYRSYSSLRRSRFRRAITIFVALLCLLTATYLTSSVHAQTSKPSVIKVDYAYYNPVSLVLKDKGWLAQDLAKDGVKIEWVLSQGSNKALEFLNGSSLDFGSTSGASALIGKANGNPIKSVYVFSKPEWTALVTGANSSIRSVKDLKGKKIAATRGTDPFIFLLRALDKNGLSAKDVEIIPLQHADGKIALEKGDVDAWAGLDPFMARSEIENGSKLFFRQPSLNSFGVLNVREAFANQYPEYVIKVLRSYEKARKWAIANPSELRKVLIRESKLTDAIAARQLERTDLSNPVIGDRQKVVMAGSGDVLKKSRVIKNSVVVDQVVRNLIDPQYINKVGK